MKINTFSELEAFANERYFIVIESRFGVFNEVFVRSDAGDDCSKFSGKRRYQNAANYISGCLEAEK